MKRSRKALTEAFSNGEIYIAGQTPYGSMFMRDVCALKKDFPLIAWRAWVDTKARYKRSILGPYWLSLSTLTFVVGYSILAGLLFKRSLQDFLGYIAAGVVAWQLISTGLSEGTKIFVTNAREMSAVRMNLLGLPIKQVLKGLIAFAHSFPIVMIVVYFTDEINIHTLMVIPGVLTIAITLVPLSAALGALSARFRDVEQAVGMFVQFFFYMTPILWKAESLGTGDGRWIALGNPLYYELSIIRLPLLGLPIPSEIWFGALGFMVFSLVAGSLFFARFRQRIPFWV